MYVANIYFIKRSLIDRFNNFIFILLIMFKKIFKNLEGKWKELNLNEEAEQDPEINFSDPDECDKWLQELHRSYGVDYSYGGFLENRSFIWKDHYNVKDGLFIHEGADFNVPLGTEVFLFEEGEVVEIIRDTEMHGGWGNAIVFWIPKIEKYVIYAHMDQDLFVSSREKYPKGSKVGSVGSQDQNGHYFPHLHLQFMDKEFASKYPQFLDVGGDSSKNSEMLQHLYDPVKFVK